MFQNEKKEDGSMPQVQNSSENTREQKSDSAISAFENNEYGGLEDIFADVDKYKQEQDKERVIQKSVTQSVSLPVQDNAGNAGGMSSLTRKRNIKIIAISSVVVILLAAIGMVIILRTKKPAQLVIQGDDVVDIATTTEDMGSEATKEVLVQEPVGPVDTDGDGIIDDVELLLGIDINIVDTDGDGLSDYDEVYVYNTNPLNTDTDSDALTDYEEVMTYYTDPLNVDTDGDSYFDGVEIKNGYSPLGPGKLQ